MITAQQAQNLACENSDFNRSLCKLNKMVEEQAKSCFDKLTLTLDIQGRTKKEKHTIMDDLKDSFTSRGFTFDYEFYLGSKCDITISW